MKYLLLILFMCSLAKAEERFGLHDVYTKAKVGTIKNFRMVIPDVLYRSGNSGGGKKPMGDKDLLLLCEQGFSLVIYGYGTGFHGEREIRCNNNSLKYISIPPFSNAAVEKIITEVHNRLIERFRGPILFHCWNGHHSSGLASATALKEYCGYTGEQALQYWIRNTDGDSNYPSHKKFILNWKPIDYLKVDGVRCL